MDSGMLNKKTKYVNEAAHKQRTAATTHLTENSAAATNIQDPAASQWQR